VLSLTKPLALLLFFAAASGAFAKDADDDTSNPGYAQVDVSVAPDPSGVPAKPAGFVHPGVLVNQAQLAEIARRVAAGIEPQKSAFVAARDSIYGVRNYVAHPRFMVECGSFSTPDLGCKAEQGDSLAAYTQALLWIGTGDHAYAAKAIEIMNGWSAVLRKGHTNANGPVQAAWTGELWPRAAEIIRYSNAGWSDADIARFQNMLRTQYLPSLIHGTTENGNKELSMSEALINIGVFLDDRKVFDHGLRMWRGRAPAYIYLPSDGPKPVEPYGAGPAIWGNKRYSPKLVSGLLQETARDSQHANLALASMVNAAETARQQGVDLYAEQGKRIMAALEYQAQFLPPNHGTPPAQLKFNLHPTWEIAYNQYHGRLGQELPLMGAVIMGHRPTETNHMMAWETLTHGDMGSIGLPPVTEAR